MKNDNIGEILYMKPYIKAVYNWARFKLIQMLKCPGVSINGHPMLGYNTKIHVQATSQLNIGGGVISDGRCTMIVDSDATLKIGNGVYFNEGMMISAKSSVKIGDGCQFGPNVKIFDNNHCYGADTGVLHSHTSAPIEIGKRCWIGTNVVILKGTTIGDHCVIGAGCVVRGNVPPCSVVTTGDNLVIRSMERKEE